MRLINWYTKLPYKVTQGSEVTLLEVLESKFENLSDQFIKYDTGYYCGGNYQRPEKGDCLVLLFLGSGVIWGTEELFSTVRRSTPKRREYYMSQRGKRFIVEIEG
jgi:hypothetical protein